MPGKRFRVEILPSALRQLRKLDRPIRARLVALIDGLSLEPRPTGATRLRGTDRPLWRVRTGSHRLIYVVENDRLMVVVVRVGHRREVYRRLT